MDKIDGKGPLGPRDNCKFEFTYAINRLGMKRVIPCVTDPQYKDVREWYGPVAGFLVDQFWEVLTMQHGRKSPEEELEEVMPPTISCYFPLAHTKPHPNPNPNPNPKLNPKPNPTPDPRQVADNIAQRVMIYKCEQEAGHELSSEERERLLPHIKEAKQQANKERGQCAGGVGGY